MGELDYLHAHKAPERLKRQLEEKVAECEVFRQTLMEYLVVITSERDHDAEYAKKLEDFIHAFDRRAVTPTRMFLQSLKAGEPPGDVPGMIARLNTWLDEINKQFDFKWRNIPSADILPFSPEKIS